MHICKLHYQEKISFYVREKKGCKFFFSSYFAELKENVRQLEEWFKEAEDVLREPLKFNQKWTRKAIDAKMEEIQVS